MDNFEFVVGTLVSGKNFIGRKEILEDVTSKIGLFSFSIHGMNKIGKTSLIKNAIEKKESNKESNLLIIYKELYKFKSVHEFMFDVFREATKLISEKREKEIRNLSEVDKANFTEFYEIFKKKNYDKSYLFGNSEFESEFLQVLKKINVKLVVVIDEFDKALEIFEAEDFNAIRSYVHDPEKYSLNIILVSRMLINEIEVKTSAYSKLSGVLSESISLVGFNNDDMKEYYSILEKITKNEIKDFYKELLEHYTGNHPFMLAIFGQEISSKGLIPPFQIFSNRAVQINSFYKSLIHNMTSDEEINEKLPIDVRRDKFDIKTKLLKYHIGPRIDLKNIDIDILKNRGFLYAKEKNSDITYATVSENFLEYFEDTLELDQINLWPQLMEFQKLIRELILRELGQNDYKKCDNYLYILALEENKFVDQHNSNNLNKNKWYYIIDKKILQGYTERKRSILKAMNFLELHNIIKHKKHFESKFKKYFISNEIQINGNSDFKLLREARNSMAHDEKELSAIEVLKVNELCAKYRKDIKFD